MYLYPVDTYGSVHQASSGSSSPCDKDHDQHLPGDHNNRNVSVKLHLKYMHILGSKVVFSNVERSLVLKSQSPNHTAVTCKCYKL